MASTPEALGYPLAQPETCGDTPLDRVANRIEQAHAMIVHACGNSGESFRELADTLQDAYLAGVLGILAAARAEVDTIPRSRCAIAALDRLDARLAHAHAMVAHACNNSGASFRWLADTVQDDYLDGIASVLCAAMADADDLERYAMQREAAIHGPAPGSAH